MAACGVVGFDPAGGHQCTREVGHDGPHQEGAWQFLEWGDFHRVFLGAGEREDLVQCHRCWRIVADDERAAHLRWHDRG